MPSRPNQPSNHHKSSTHKRKRPKKPPLTIHTTTLWDYPSQSHAYDAHGNKDYIGVTPSHVIWNLLKRYTHNDALIVDPFCGSGTSLDVARELGLRAKGFDIHPTRDHVQRSDARQLPLKDNCADLWFADPPYSTHIDYSNEPQCLGKIHAGSPEWQDAFRDVFKEAKRVLKAGGVAAVYISDSFEKKGANKGFYPLGMWCYQLLEALGFEPIDWVSVKRYGKVLDMGNYHQAAERDNFFLRGFNHLIIFRKPGNRFGKPQTTKPDLRRRKTQHMPKVHTHKINARNLAKLQKKSHAKDTHKEPFNVHLTKAKTTESHFKSNKRRPKKNSPPLDRNDSKLQRLSRS